MVTAEVDADRVIANFSKLVTGLDPATNFSLREVAEEVLRLSQEQVPHDTGTLQDSGTAEPFGEDWVVGYHTPYAARLHEHPEYRYQRGRKGKYLEDPIRTNASALGLRAANGLAERWFNRV